MFSAEEMAGVGGERNHPFPSAVALIHIRLLQLVFAFLFRCLEIQAWICSIICGLAAEQQFPLSSSGRIP